MNSEATKPHQGRNVKKIREMLGIKQMSLATSLGLSQQAISQLEQREILDAPLLEKVSTLLGVPEEAIKNLTDDTAINVIANTITNNDQSSVVNYYPSFNPIDKIVELYERLLALEKEKSELLQKLLDKGN